MKDRIIASIELPFCQLSKTKSRNYYAVKTAVGTSYYSKNERKIAFKHFRNEMNWKAYLKPTAPRRLRGMIAKATKGLNNDT